MSQYIEKLSASFKQFNSPSLIEATKRGDDFRAISAGNIDLTSGGYSGLFKLNNGRFLLFACTIRMRTVIVFNMLLKRNTFICNRVWKVGISSFFAKRVYNRQIEFVKNKTFSNVHVQCCCSNVLQPAQYSLLDFELKVRLLLAKNVWRSCI